ncbi:MAG: RidA family protein [bacterium]|nr:RidA family protein [bacterium]MDE0238907.1 RidA family protein [bacterium]
MTDIQRLQPGELFSGAVIHGDTVWLSGKVASDSTGDVQEQTRNILEQIDATLEACGSSRSRLLSVQIWLADIGDWAAMNEVYTAWIDPGNKPCRATVEAALAHPDLLVEIMCVAAR